MSIEHAAAHTFAFIVQTTDHNRFKEGSSATKSGREFILYAQRKRLKHSRITFTGEYS
jgi:hypothetical protein